MNPHSYPTFPSEADRLHAAGAVYHHDYAAEIDSEDEILADEAAVRRAAWRRPSTGRWIAFAALALVVVVIDQLSKAWVAGQLSPGAGMVVIPDLLNIVYGQNSGILFGLLPQSAPAFAIVSMGVTALIVVYHAKAGRGIVTTIALGLLLGGAIGGRCRIKIRTIHTVPARYIDIEIVGDMIRPE